MHCNHRYIKFEDLFPLVSVNVLETFPLLEKDFIKLYNFCRFRPSKCEKMLS